MSVPLVVVAHGSRDPRSAATIRTLVDRIAVAVPDVDVRASFLDLSSPAVTEILPALYNLGYHELAVVPLLLGSAYHARIDLPRSVDEVTARHPGLRVEVAEVLGIDPLLEQVALDRLTESGADLSDPGLDIVLAAVGSSNTAANAAICQLAQSWQTRFGVPVTAAFATAKPDIPEAIASLHARGVRRLAVASWFLAPGLLPDRVAQLAAETDARALLAEPLGPDPRVVELVLRRYHWALKRMTVSAA